MFVFSILHCERYLTRQCDAEYSSSSDEILTTTHAHTHTHTHQYNKWFLKKSRLEHTHICLLYTSPSPRDRTRSRMPSSA